MENQCENCTYIEVKSNKSHCFYYKSNPYKATYNCPRFKKKEQTNEQAINTERN